MVRRFGVCTVSPMRVHPPDTCPLPKGGRLFRASLTTVIARRHPRAEGNTGDIMKKTYEKPILTKREKLSAVTAIAVASGQSQI